MTSQNPLSIRQFCEKYGMHRNTFYLHRSKGIAPRTVKIGRAVRVLPEDEAAWVESLKESSSGSEG